MQRKQFNEELNETERNAWLTFKMICKDFLGKYKTASYQDVDFVQSYGMQYEPENPISGNTLGFFPREARGSQ